MLRIIQAPPEFSLQNVLDVVPPPQLQIPRHLYNEIIDNERLYFLQPLISQLKDDGNEFFVLDVITSNMRIVGRERNGKILVSRIGFDSKPHVMRVVTFIDYYDMNTESFGKLFEIYRFHDIINCVSCTVSFIPGNEDLADIISYVAQFQDPIGRLKYETFVTEVQGTPRTLKAVTDTPQFVKFVNGHPSSNKKKVMCWIQDRTLSKCLIPIKKVERGSAVIKNVLFMVKTSDIYWFDWDYETDQLYLIHENKTVNRKTHSHMLKIIVSFEPRFDVYQYLFSPRIDPNDDWKRVDMHENNFVLCQRHYELENDSGIRITIHLLRQAKRLSYVIELSTLEPDQIMETKVLFQGIDQTLMIYIPGFHFQLIHFNAPDPTFGLCASEFANPLPHQSDFEPANIEYFQDNRKEKSDKANLIHNVTNGEVYKYYNYQSSTIQTIFEEEGSFRHIAAMHFVIAHLKNFELRDEIIKNLIIRNPEYITSELLTEYILGSSCILLAKKYPNAVLNFPQTILKSIPDDTRHNFSNISDIEYQNDSPSPDKTFHLDLYGNQIKLGMPERRSGSGNQKMKYSSPKRNIEIIETRQLSKTQGHTSPILRFVSNIFSSSNDSMQITISDAPEDPNRVQIIEFITQFLTSNTTLSRNEVVDWAVNYRDVQGEVVNNLFSILNSKKRKRSSERIKKFRVMSNFHCSLERNWFPFPQDFRIEITKLGYKCLPRNIFSQFLEMGVFDLSPDFMRYILSHSDVNPETSKYICTFINQLTQEEAIDIMLPCDERQGMEEKNNYLIEILLSKTNRYQKIDMEEMVDADFLPLSIYLESLQKDQVPEEETFEWIKYQAHKIFKKELEIPDIVPSPQK